MAEGQRDVQTEGEQTVCARVCGQQASPVSGVWRRAGQSPVCLQRGKLPQRTWAGSRGGTVTTSGLGLRDPELRPSPALVIVSVAWGTLCFSPWDYKTITAPRWLLVSWWGPPEADLESRIRRQMGSLGGDSGEEEPEGQPPAMWRGSASVGPMARGWLPASLLEEGGGSPPSTSSLWCCRQSGLRPRQPRARRMQLARAAGGGWPRSPGSEHVVGTRQLLSKDYRGSLTCKWARNYETRWRVGRSCTAQQCRQQGVGMAASSRGLITAHHHIRESPGMSSKGQE